MTPVNIIRRAQEDGVTLALTPAGTIKARGDATAINRWLPEIQEHKPEILAVLQESVNESQPEVFSFSPPGDPANDDEAILERAAIMAEGNGWNDARALRGRGGKQIGKGAGERSYSTPSASWMPQRTSATYC